MTMPPLEICDLARRTKDARFDGLFFTAVRSTRIFCRPVCPAPTPKPQHILYFPSAAAAGDAGYRPCLRCRPELSPGVRVQDETVRRALALIGEGWLEERSLEDLASTLCVSARHLRRLFTEKLGSSPLEVYQAHRVLLAKQLLTETDLPVTQVALAAGFASLRRFNDGFKARCGLVPSAVRRQRQPSMPAGSLRLRLAYRPPLDFAYQLGVLRSRATPAIERVTESAYERNVSTPDRAQWIRVSAGRADRSELLLETFGIAPTCIQPFVRRVRRLFDLDADLHSAHAVLTNEPSIAKSIGHHPGRRLVGAWDELEAVTRAIVLRSRGPSIVDRCMVALSVVQPGAPEGLDRRFPTANELADIAESAQAQGGKAVASAVRAFAIAVVEQRVDLSAGQALEDFVARLCPATGLPESDVQVLAAQLLGHPDAWPHGLTALHLRPWRAYAALHAFGGLPASARAA
jgi:AraC family transcriptional regulator, regulatory protein of adaptative response / DNA-3-methyladenine glycosylase II